MSREEPRTRAEAWTYQLEDDVKTLRACSVLPDKKPFMDALNVLKKRVRLCEESIKLDSSSGTKKVTLFPCSCTEYNGSQCYNCLNGAHSICSGKRRCKKSRASYKSKKNHIVP